jgi:hypothetical protein
MLSEVIPSEERDVVSLDALVSLSDNFAEAFGGIGIELKALGFKASSASGCPICHLPNSRHASWQHALAHEKALIQ